MKLNQSLLAAAGVLAAAAGLAVSSQSASARVVCNSHGDCWRTEGHYSYPRDLGIRVYNDRYADEGYRHRHWRRYHRTWHDEHHEHDRGAWRNGVWFSF